MSCNQMNKIFYWGLDMFYFVLIVPHKISCFSSCMYGETEVSKFSQGHLLSEWQILDPPLVLRPLFFYLFSLFTN